MANLNKVMLIGRLTGDPEMRTFANGGKVANIRFAVNNRKKNTATGEWEDDPCFVDVKAFNRGERGRQLADLCEQYLHKGHQAYIEGHLTLDQWTGQDGQKQQRLRIVMDDLQFLEPKRDGSGPSSRMAPAPARAAASSAPTGGFEDEGAGEPAPAEPEQEIPF
jgi:single-strand DNA-binding protein